MHFRLHILVKITKEWNDNQTMGLKQQKESSLKLYIKLILLLKGKTLVRLIIAKLEEQINKYPQLVMSYPYN